jgi:hypothetical protein
MRIGFTVLLIVALFPSGWSVQPNFAVTANGQSGQDSVAPRVSAEFEAEIARLAAEGLRLKEAVEASLEAGANHLAAIFERASPKAPNEAMEFRLIESDARGARSIFRRSEFFFSFPASKEISALNAADINGDGRKEILVQSSSGGNCWGCNPTEVYRVINHKGELIAAGPVQKIIDLDRDNIAELVVTDARWEIYDDLSHADAPTATIVYAWRNGRYVYASSEFATFYGTELTRLRAQLGQARAQITAEDFSDDAYIGRAMAIAITYAHSGLRERGLRELEAMMNAFARSASQKKRRAQILEDFLRGESYRKLREMKHGDPIL